MTESLTPPPPPPPPALPYGTWPSPITAADVAGRRRLVSYPRGIGKDVWWQERLPGEGGRVTVMHLGADAKQRSLLPQPWDARTRVHEYGGLSYLPVPARGAAGGPAAIIFANYADQRLYFLEPAGPGGESAGPRPLTPEPGGGAGQPSLRYADFTLSPDRGEVWCIQERHHDGKVTRAIVAIPLDGSAAGRPDAVRELVSGSDFYAFPTPSPDGKRLAWICWNHPRMPWDGTELRVAPIEDGMPGRGRLVKGGMQESVLAPLWRDATTLYVATDWPGWWNLYQVGLVGQPPQALYPAEEEFAGPLWQLGDRPYAMLGDGRLAVLHGVGGMRLGLLDPETAELADLDIGYPVFASGLSADGMSILGVAGGPTVPLSIVRVDAATGTLEVLWQEPDAVPDTAYLPVPRQVLLEGSFGRTVHALVYPPANPGVTAPEGELAPYVVWVHGGPSANAVPLLDLEKAYFTSRGIGIVDVNYGGSTGYGRRYRERLRRQWGVVDVEDAIAAARALADTGQADGGRLAIRGGSAGGWTTLAAVTTHAGSGSVFSAAVSYYGVADLRELAAHTHDFESRYLDGMVGPLPGYEAVYVERSPVGHVTGATCPILLLQGADDPVVPPAQSEAIAAQLAAHGIRHAHLTFEGESHGFRRAETIIRSLEAELSFYAQILGFSAPGIPALEIVSGRTR
ncbi:MAG TPA: prolyl oligopeptidase family serine peptidase [Streptosporangiaceae bacterium]|nr:prolyl oligopeptidase family serine peptidase [Streptosporangiaceae bacterium]